MLYVVDMTLGNLIKKARVDRQMSLEALGTKVGVSRQLVWQWERGDSDARKHIKALSVALEVPVEYFYGPGRPDATLDAKIKRLSPDQQELLTAMVDTMLAQQEKETETPNKA